MDLAIEAEGLVKTYPKGVRALDGVSFEVAAGSVFGLVGPNGAGKSTTVKILTTLSRPDERRGRVCRHRRRCAGPDARAPRDRLRAQKSGVDVHATGRENLLLQGRLYGMARPRARAACRHHARALRPGRRGPRVTSTYSGGMQRKLDVAMGLVHSPAGPVPGRADDRSRPRGPRRHVGRDRAPRRRGGPHHPAHHALPRRGRPPGRRSPSSTAAGSWPRARPTSSRASCTATPCSSSSTRRDQRTRHGGAAEIDDVRDVVRGRPPAARPRRQWRPRRARHAAGTRGPRRAGGLGHGRAPLARRRLPEVHGPRFEEADAAPEVTR